MKPDMSLDMQQSWLREQVAPHANRITSAKNPMAELAKVAYEAILEKLTAIANTEFGSGYLALVGGIQLNMPKGHPDYFVPCHFTIQKRGSAPKHVLDRLTSQHEYLKGMCMRPSIISAVCISGLPRPVPAATKELTESLKSSLELNFPRALSGPEVHERLLHVLEDYGFTPQNTILGTSICSDEVNTTKGTLADIMKEYWGTTFPMGGIGGAPYVGKTGFFAFSHHVPDNGNVLVLFGPHVGVTDSGEIGKCLRYGQSSESTACGACVAAYKQSIGGGLKPDLSLDMQQSWLRQRIAPHVDRITVAKSPMGELAKVAYEAVLEKMTAIASTDFGSGHLALVGGIQLNMPTGYPDYFVPCHFTVQSRDSPPKSALDTLTETSRFF